MKYMIMLYGSQQDYDAMAGKATDKPAWSGEDFAAMGAFMETWNNELVESGEFVDAQGLAAPVHTRRVAAARRGAGGHRRAVRRRPRRCSPATRSSSARASTGPPRSPPGWRTARPGRSGGRGRQYVDVRPILEGHGRRRAGS